MLKNYLTSAIRSLLRHKLYSVINILGLAIGMACCILIMLWVMDELSFDKRHTNADNIHRLCVDANFGSPFIAAISMVPAAPRLIEEYPEVVNAARISPLGSAAVKYKDKLFREEYIGYADNSVFQVFTFPFLAGDPNSALNTPYTVVITREMAEKYFGDEDPLGKTLKFDGETDFTVTGVVENIPRNSHFTFNMLRSIETQYAVKRAEMEMWFNIQYFTYLLLADNTDYREFEQKLPGFVDKHMGEPLKSSGATLKCFLQPLTSIHLHSNLAAEIGVNGSITYVYIFTAIATLILIIACMNYINITTARAGVRSREVAVRKTFGAGRSNLIAQLIVETILFSLFAVLLAVLLIEIALPFFNSLADRRLTFDALGQLYLLAALLCLPLLVGFIAGSYPALILSAFQPVKIIQGGTASGSPKTKLHIALVVLQFTISIALIIGASTVYSQLMYVKNKEMGFSSEQVLVIPRIGKEIKRSMDSFRNELKSVPGVLNAAAASFVPGGGCRLAITFPEGFAEDKPQTMNILDIDPYYLRTIRMELVLGRNFSNEMPTDVTESILINQTAAMKFGWDEPLGKKILCSVITDTGFTTLNRSVVGVVKDFHQQSLHSEIPSMIIGMNASEFRSVLVRITPENVAGTIKGLEEKWRERNPERPFHYFFIDEIFDRRYRADRRLGNIILYFSLLAVFLSCMGLFGMSTYSAERRTKEIGIRKVLGATVAGIVRLMSGEFLLLVGLANLIAWPLSYFAMNRWLESFAYRIRFVDWMWSFPAAGLAAIVIALLTVSLQSFRAAAANPADSLRYE